MPYTYPSVAIQTYLTFTAVRWGQFPTITFSNGAVAGSEVVSVDSSNNITIQIESGVSTNAQIKAAVEAHTVTSGFKASDLVTVTITSGHTADTQVSCVSAALSGGVSTAVKSSLVLAGLKYEAKTAGAAGNSIRVKYTSGGSLSVAVSTNDIAIQLKNDSTSTNALIAAAVLAYGPSDALVSVVSSGEALSRVPTTDAAPDFVALTGGLDAAVASVEVQDLTISSDSSATGTADNGRMISYTTGATAGAEVVSGTTNPSVQIQSGVSTATQVKAALDAYVPFNGVASTGTFTVSSYAPLHLTKAAGTITYGSPTAKAAATKQVTYGSPDVLTAASPSGVITFGAPVDNSTVVLTGLPTDGTKTFTKKTATTLTAATPSGVITFGAPSDNSTVVFTGLPTDGTKTFTKKTAVSAVASTGTITVSNYALLHKQKASKAIQDLTYTAVNFGVAGNDISVEYVADIAGDYAIVEVPTAGAILVHMDDTAVTGTTADTIKAAVNADSQASLLVLISGTSSNVQAVQAETNLENGQDASTVTVNGIVLTETTDWLATVSNDSTAASIASAITAATATTLCTATAVATDVVTITANTPGVAGDSIALATSDAVNLLKSGATLSGGVDAYVLGADEFEVIADLTALIQALTDLNATDDSTDITLAVVTAGTAMNSATVTGTSSYSALSLTFSGGLDTYVLGPTEFEVIADLTALIQALTDLNASDDSTDITITVATAGTAMNSATVTGTSSYSALSVTFSGGLVASTITVDSNMFTCVSATPGPTEFSSISELTALIQALTNVNASDDSSIITIVAAVKGSAGNSIGISKTGAGLTFTGSTLSNGADGSTVTVNSVTSTCIDAAPGANEFTSISELTALVTAIAGVDATDNGSVVAVVAATAGTAGNAITMSQSGAGLTLSGAYLTGGYDAATVSVNGVTLTESVEWSAASSNNATAASIASAITTATATTLCTAAAITTNVCTITANAINASGDAILLATSDVTNLAKSGAHLTGGINSLVCVISGTGSNAQKTVNGASMTGAVAPNVLGFFVDDSITALTSSYVYFPFAVRYNNIVLNNDETTGNKQVIFSWDGINNHGILDPGESVNLVNANRSSIFLKYGNAAPAYRVFGSGTF